MFSILSTLWRVPETRNGIVLSSGVVSLVVGASLRRRAQRDESKGAVVGTAAAAPAKPKSSAGVNGRFFRQFAKMLRILVPGVATREFLFSVLVALFLGLRTLADVWMIENNTKIEKAIITRNRVAFAINLSKYIAFLLPISFANQALKYSLNELALLCRVRMTNALFANYMKGNTFYRLSNLPGRVENVDQLVTNDVQKFCDSVVDLYSNLSKPILDVVIYALKLSSSHGASAPGTMLLYLVGAGMFLTTLRRPLARLTSDEQAKEGEFRTVCSRLVTNSEEISFYGGNRTELGVLESVFAKLVAQIRRSIEFRFAIGLVDNIVAKYLATVVGFWIVSRPYFGGTASASLDVAMEDYYRSGRMLISLASAVGRIVLAGRELTRLSAFTNRVYELVERVQMMQTTPAAPFVVREDATSETVESAAATSAAPDSTDVASVHGGELGDSLKTQLSAWRARRRVAIDDPLLHSPSASGHVTVRADANIEFDNVDLVSPDGKLLVSKLTFCVPRGTNVMVTGPNGSGKSSLFRVIGGLWPIATGNIVRPPLRDVLFVPQRPYLVLGTLRDQLVYPHTAKQMRDNGVSDSDLIQLLSIVDPANKILGAWQLDDVRDWSVSFSGGQKQRVAMARLFYHKPAYAILDECTSAVSDDVEDRLYQTAKHLNITLFTVSHRKSLLRHHEYVLHFHGGIAGDWSFERIAQDDTNAAASAIE